MSEQKRESSQPIITEDQPFTVKVKLLSNETFEIQTRPDIPISELKKIIEEKVKVPIDKQKLIFSGKQLENQQPLSQYVKQSGLTIHLIARSQPAQQNPQQPQPQQPRPQHNPQPQQQQGQQLPPNPFGNIGNIFSSLMGRPPTQEMNQSLNSFFGNMGNIQIRMNPPPFGQPQGQNMPTSPNTTQQEQPTNPQQANTNNQQGPQPIPQQQQATVFSVNYTPLISLQSNISRLSLPQEQIPIHTNPRQQTLLYLRKLQTEMLRFMPQLSRSIQMLQEGRVNHLNQLVPILQAFSASNTGAVDVIQRFANLQQRMPQHHHHNHPHQHQHQHQQQNAQQGQTEPQNRQNNQQLPISPNTQPSVPQNQTAQNSQQPQQNQANPMGMLGGLLAPGSGFNLANIFAQNRQQQPQQQSQPTQPPQQQQQPQPEATTNYRERIPDPQPISRANLANQLSQQLNAPLASNQQGQGGATMMQAFNSMMQQEGGIGSLLGMSFGDMFEEEDVDPIYTKLFKVLSGSELIGMILSKNFSFFNTKKSQCREGLTAAVESAGSRQELVRRYSKDIAKLFIPENQVKNKEQCRARIEKIISQHVQKIVTLILDAPEETNLEVEVVKHMKLLYCRSIEQLFKYVDTLETAFNIFKENCIRVLTKYAQGLAGMFYGIIERDLIRVYREYDQDQKRRRAMSEEEAKDEKELLQQIEEEAKRDVDFMASFKHSKFYPAKH